METGWSVPALGRARHRQSPAGAGTASLKGWHELQALDGLVRGSDASQYRLPSPRVLPVPHLVLVLLSLSTEPPKGQGLIMLVPPLQC